MNAQPTQPILEGRASLQIDRILVPTDFSDDAMKASRYAVRFARQFGASVILLHVFQPPQFCYERAGIEPFETVRKRAEDEMRRQLEVIRQGIELEAPAETMLCEGSPEEVIASIARAREVDLIVISTHGFTGLRHLTRMGSTAERVVRVAPCPVFVVRQKERDFVD